jgi:superfamily II DNA or RNA helicase
MPRVFDNIENGLLPALRDTLTISRRSDFCVGYFNLRGWKAIDDLIALWPGGEGGCCRLLVGMQRLPEDELRAALGVLGEEHTLDNQTAIRLKRKLAEEFRAQLTLGMPSNEDEAGLRRLAEQLRSGKVVVKLFLRHTLHAKLYLLFRSDPNNPITGFLGSSNLTLSGLSKQGELNVDVLDHDATEKLANWFEERWEDRWCIDITDDLIAVIEESWARDDLVEPHLIYVKMAYHLAQEARSGLSEFRIPREFGKKLFPYQEAAVKIAAHHLQKRGGVLIGDVVGLGKTLMATAVAKIFQDDHSAETLIICPKNLVRMWEAYVEEYRLIAKVLSVTRAIRELPSLRRFRLVLIDESHNLRNREGQRYKAIQAYLADNESRCILLSATPYNKTYIDLSSQLRLFVPEDHDLGIRPERLLSGIGETEFIRRHQCSVRSLAAFEKSEFPDDWRELMRLYMVRRTRTFIQENYASTDPESGRRYLTFEDGTRSYFPERRPRTVKFKINDEDPTDQYAGLYGSSVVDAINKMHLPRYGLGNYVVPAPDSTPTTQEDRQLDDLSRAGKRLMGFCRTNLFKRLESSGEAFQQSLERHVLRNYVFLHAIDNDLSLPLGTQDAGLLDSANYDEDIDDQSADAEIVSDGEDDLFQAAEALNLRDIASFKRRAADAYELYSGRFKKRFKWLRPGLFISDLRSHLIEDSATLMKILGDCGPWKASQDRKLDALVSLLKETHPTDKVLIFSQFADTVRYLERQLKKKGIVSVSGVTGETDDPTSFAWCFSPVSNGKRAQVKPEEELRILIATDVLSEGQNLQDCSLLVNFDLPWAIIRLIQRAGRVDRIGQRAAEIICYSFLPADGVERLINLRARVSQRLRENAEVVGTDESFFEDEEEAGALIDLYSEKSGILDGDADTEVDLASYAYQIWRNAIESNPSLARLVPSLPDVIYSTKAYLPSANRPGGALVYMRTSQGNDALTWVDHAGEAVTQSQFEILRAAACEPGTQALPRQDHHHEIVGKAVAHIAAEEKKVGGQLGRPTGARFRTYERLKDYAARVKGELFDTPDLSRAVEEIYRFPLRQAATDTLNRQLKLGISDEKLADLVLALREEDRLCIVQDEQRQDEPQIICSLGLASGTN